MGECEYFKLSHVASTSSLLLRTVASNCLIKTVMDPFHSPMSAFLSAQQELLDYLKNMNDSILAQNHEKWKGKSNCEIVELILEEFISSRMTIFHKISSLFATDVTKTEKVEILVAEIVNQKKWPDHERELPSKNLLKTIDKTSDSHCGIRFEDEAALNAHQETCKFRPVACDNEECPLVVSACQREEHDSVCPYKLLECSQKCTSMIRRAEMEKHCSTVCPKKVIQCPYVNAGCNASFFQEELRNHTKSSLEIHLFLVFKAFESVKSEVADHSSRLDIAEKTTPLLEKTFDVQLKTLGIKLDEFQKKIEKDISSIQGDIRAINARRQ